MKGCHFFGDTFLKVALYRNRIKHAYITFHCLNTWQWLIYSLYITEVV